MVGYDQTLTERNSKRRSTDMDNIMGLRIDVDDRGYRVRSEYDAVDETYPDLEAAHKRIGALLDAAAEVAAAL
jgi:hypothetical protein